jgi:sulfatase modifying factor 1
MKRRLIAAGVGLGVASLAAMIWWWSGPSAVALASACPLPPSTGARAGMVFVPARTFEMGDSVYAEEGPTRTVTTGGFWMDRTEVTNAEFAAFVKATGYVTTAEQPGRTGAAVFVMPSGNASLSSLASWWRYVDGANWRHPGGPDTSIDGRETYPVVAISFDDAQAYARWKGRKLPTEEQWERASRGSKTTAPEHEQPRDANTWQGIFPVIDTAEDGHAGISPVGCFKPNDLGLYDMIGNVWELTDTAYAGHVPKAQVIKGGSFLCAPNYCMRYRPGARQPQESDLGTSHVGFRTILEEPN